ncbi:MAG: DUF3108 domain-containing protein [Chloroflexota bacterium]
MKRVFGAMLLLILAVTAFGCNQQGSGASAGLALGSAPWQDGDKVNYNWLDKDGKQVGTAEVTFAKDGEAWAMTWADKIGGLEQTQTVRMDGQTLKPLSNEKTIKQQGSDVTVDATYQDGKLNIKAVVNGENKEASVDVPADALDNDQLLVTLRALPFADGYEGKFVNVVSQNATKISTTVRVQGQEQVTVPAGTFTAWKVQLDFGQAKQTAWYQTDGAHSLLQYDNGTTKLVLVK